MKAIETHVRHEKILRREELRQLEGRRRYLDVPHLFWDGSTETTVGDGPFPENSGGVWALPAGVWAVQASVRASAATDPLQAVLRAAETYDDLAAPIYESKADFMPETSDAVEGTMSGEIGGQIELAPLVSDGVLYLWLTWPGSALLTFARLSR